MLVTEFDYQFLYLLEALIVPLLIPLFLTVSNRKKTSTKKIALNNNKKAYLLKLCEFEKQLPSAFLANIIFINVYMIENNFKFWVISICWIFVLLVLLLNIAVTKDYNVSCLRSIIIVTGVFLFLVTITIVFFTKHFQQFLINPSFIKSNLNLLCITE